MRKRAAMARTLIYEPETLLMDEPFGALDSQLKLLMLDQLQSLTQHRRMSVVFVTHDLGEAITLSDRIVVLSARPGRIRAIHDVKLDAAARRVQGAVHRRPFPSSTSGSGTSSRTTSSRGPTSDGAASTQTAVIGAGAARLPGATTRHGAQSSLERFFPHRPAGSDRGCCWSRSYCCSGSTLRSRARRASG